MKSKIEIKDQPFDITDSEVHSTMDFGSVVEQYRSEKLESHIMRKLTIRFSILLILITAIGVLIYFSDKPSKETDSSDVDKNHSHNESNLLSDSSKFDISDEFDSLILEEHTKEKILDKSQVKEIQKESESNDQVGEIGVVNQTAIVDSSSHQGAPIISEPREKEKTTENVVITARPLQGEEQLYTYFDQNLIYPQSAIKDSIEGIVEVQFSILKDSTVANIKIIKSLGGDFDKETIRVIKAMPKWIPATKNGKPIISRISIPLTFNIEK